MPEATSAATWIRFVTGVADQAIAETAQAMHRAITDANFRWVGPLGRPVKRVHDAVADQTWGAVRTVVRGAGAVAAEVADSLATVGDESPGAARARAISIGSLDAGLVATAPGMDHDMTVVVDRGDPPSGPDDGRASDPDAAGCLVVFVHGLVDTEAAWTSTSLPGVATTAGAVALLVRYGSGRSVARNGADLDDLLEEVVAGWPVPVTRIVVVAHSMGGLVTRAAVLAAVDRGHAWPAAMTDVVHLATPNLGSWLEKVANVTSWTLRRVSPRTAPLGQLLDQRSRGIKDLRFGTLSADPTLDGAIDDLLVGRGEPVPWPDDTDHHLVVGRLRPGTGHPLNAVLGDGLVRARSAAGAGRWWRIPAGGRVEVVEVVAGHNRLAGHPDVAALVSSVLAVDPVRASS